jgi:uncharacterized membrane protein SpoIIM required for sporulation
MVLELLIGPKKAETHPVGMFLYGVLYASIAIILSLWIFKSQSSIVMVFLTVLACIPLLHRTLKQQEEFDLEIDDERLLIKKHWKALKFLMYLFLGFLVAYALWFILLPETLSTLLFQSQLDTIQSINGRVIHGYFIGQDIFMKILLNNIKVLFFTVFFSFFYGAGALFILVWNASVISAAMGTFVRDRLSSLASYFHILPLALVRYMTHGVFEILAYFIGGLAGALISFAIINSKLSTKQFKHILKDSLDLILIALAILVVGAVVEVYFTPLIVSLLL